MSDILTVIVKAAGQEALNTGEMNIFYGINVLMFLGMFELFLDPNIPETGEQRRKSSNGDEDCCYTHCGSPGRGLCEHCPGRPSTNTPEPVNCPTDNTTKASGCKTSAAPHTRTLNKVFLLWTAWIIFTNTNNILQCILLILCATSVQRTTCWIKTIILRRPCS